MAAASVLPTHWTACKTNDGLYNSGFYGLGTYTYGSKRVTLKADSKESKEVNRLVQKTWERGKFHLDSDGKNLGHPGIQVIQIDRIENPELYRQYNTQKEAFLNESSVSAFSGVQTLPGSSGPVKTTECLKPNSSLRINVCSPINEHYLFHGTKDDNVSPIANTGFNMNKSTGRSLLGRALYFAESSTKADMYADQKDNRTAGEKHMFLSRVLVGNAHLHMDKKKRGFRQPPCKNKCHPKPCYCSKQDRYHSVIGNCRSRPFRIFAVYSSSRCYPEYLITYTRLSYLDLPRQVVSDDDSEDGTPQPKARAAYAQVSPFSHADRVRPLSSQPSSQSFSSEHELDSDFNTLLFVSRLAQQSSHRFISAHRHVEDD